MKYAPDDLENRPGLERSSMMGVPYNIWSHNGCISLMMGVSRSVSAARRNIPAHSLALSRSSRVPPENSKRPSRFLRSRHAPKLAINSASRAGPGVGLVEGCLIREI